MIIYEAVEFIRKELNAYLKQDKGDPDPVVLSSILAQDGTVPPEASQKVVLSLINIEREATASSANFYTRTPDGNIAKRSPAVNLNLYLLLTGSHDDYGQSIKLLSNSIGFFQANQVFTPASSPDFPQALEKITFEVVNLQLQDMSHLWGALGAKYMPSIIYKVRMLTFQEAWITEERPPISGRDSTLSN